MVMQPPTFDAVFAAAARIGHLVERTPVITSRSVDARAGVQVFMKCENFQRVGAFKFRGASHAVSRLDAETAGRGVVTHSSGNHAQALALAARLRGIRAHIVMPRTAPQVKQRAVVDFGGIVHLCEPTLAAREETSSRLAVETGGTLIPPYDHPDVIAGQGTATLELLQSIPDLDAVIAPIGGGGLVSGMCLAAQGIRGAIRCLAAEPAGADDAARSLAAGRLLPSEHPDTIADGLLTSLGAFTWPIVQRHVERIFVVPDPAIAEAMRFVMERVKIVLEPSCAVPFAAIFTDAFRAWARDAGVRRLGLIVSGGNLDFDRLPWTSKESSR